MAAPPDVNMVNYAGKYAMNKSLCDDVDPMLALQGVGWLTRKAIGLATVVLFIKKYEIDGVWHIDIVSSVSGLTQTTEERTLDEADRDHTDKIFGKVKGRSRETKLSEYKMMLTGGTASDEEFLLAKKDKNGKPTKFLENDLIQSYVESVDGRDWRAEQVWGFEDVDGLRRHTRRIVCRKGDKVLHVRTVYDYKGPLDKADDGLAYGD